MNYTKHNHRSRADVLQCKADLAAVLGPHQEAYWQAMRAYFQSQKTRSELDEQVAQWLRPPDLYLHNEFIRSVHFNCQPHIPPPTPPRSPSDNTLGPNTTSTMDRRFAWSLLQALTPAELERLQLTGSTSLRHGNPTSATFWPTQWRFQNKTAHHTMTTAQIMASLASDGGALAEGKDLMLVMQQIAREQGLGGGVNENCLVVMRLALESFLRTVWAQARWMLERDKVKWREEKKVAMNLKDLYFCLQIDRRLLAPVEPSAPLDRLLVASFQAKSSEDERDEEV